MFPQGRRTGRRPLILASVALLVLLGGLLTLGFAVFTRPTLATIRAAAEQGDYDAGLQQVNVYLQSHPADVEAWTLKAHITEQKRDLPETVHAWSRLVDLVPESAERHFKYASLLLQTSQYTAAEAELRQVLTSQPSHEGAQTELQWILFHQLRERELEAFLESCLEQQPTELRLLYHLLMTTHKGPNPHESLPVLEEIDRAVPDQPSILLGMARCRWKLGETAAAKALLARVQNLQSMHPELALTRAEFALEQADFDHAAAVLAAAGSDRDWQQNDRWWWIQSRIALAREDLPASLTAVETARRLYPRSLIYLQAQATLHKLLQQPAAASALQAEAAQRREAESRLSIIVQSGALSRLTPQLMGEIGELLTVQRKDQQAGCWLNLARGMTRR